MNLLQLGRVDYATALRLQQTLVELRKRGQIADTLLLLEHTPVITLGRNSDPQHVLASRQQLAARGVEVFESDRGGDVTFHGPGQLVGYPVFDLRQQVGEDGERKTLGAVEYVRMLEEVLIRTCAEFSVPTQRMAGMTGVWTRPISRAADARPEAGPEKKVAAIGVHISRAVTSHGFALNVATELDYFDLIVPCGLTGRQVTSLQKEMEAVYATRTLRPLTLEEVAEAVARNFGKVFRRQILWLESLEALLPAPGEAPQPQDTPLEPPEDLRRIRGEEDIYLA